MTTDAATRAGAGEVGLGWRGIAVLATALLAAAAMYGGGVLLPYYVNDLHLLPLAEVASGAHDPKDLWPHDAWAGLPQVAGFFSLVVLPFAAMVGLGVGGASLVLLWRRAVPQRVTRSLALLVVMAASVAVLAFLFSPTGAALATWRMD